MRCDRCGNLLVPASARFDGVPTTVGYQPCPCKPAVAPPSSFPALSSEEQQRLAEIRARIDAATPGPWLQTRDISTGVKIWSNEQGSPPLFQVCGGVRYSRVTDADPVPQWQKDADLVRNAPSDLDFTLAILSRLTSGGSEPAGTLNSELTVGGTPAGDVLTEEERKEPQ